MKYLFIVAICAGLFFSCSCEDKNPNKVHKVKVETEEVKIDFKFVRLEDQLFSLKNAAEFKKFLTDHPLFCKDFLGVDVRTNKDLDRVVAPDLYNFYSNKQLYNFYQYTKKDFGDMAVQRKEMEELFKYIRHYYPTYYIPEVNTVITGFHFDKDISASDSLIVISIDYFLGPKAPFRPDAYAYFLARYDKPFMIPMMSQAISIKFNEFGKDDKTMLANMIYYGKAHYFTERMMPELDDTLNIMYTAQELRDVEDNLTIIWSHFVDKKLFYEKDNFIVEKYVGERPKVQEIGDKCPGRVGRWLGWQIVRAYMKENPSVTLPQLMAETDAQKIFKLSKYKPKK